MLFGQGQRAENAEQVGQRTDKAEHVGQPVDSGHSRAVGGGPVSHPEVTSHPVIAPGAAEGSVDIVEDSHVVTPAPAQEDLEQQVQPVFGRKEKSVDSQVELTLLGKPDDDVPLQFVVPSLLSPPS